MTPTSAKNAERDCRLTTTTAGGSSAASRAVRRITTGWTVMRAGKPEQAALASCAKASFHRIGRLRPSTARPARSIAHASTAARCLRPASSVGSTVAAGASSMPARPLPAGCRAPVSPAARSTSPVAERRASVRRSACGGTVEPTAQREAIARSCTQATESQLRDHYDPFRCDDGYARKAGSAGAAAEGSAAAVNTPSHKEEQRKIGRCRISHVCNEPKKTR